MTSRCQYGWACIPAGSHALAHLVAATAAAAGLALNYLAITVRAIRVRRCSTLASPRAPRLTVTGLTSGRHARLRQWCRVELERPFLGEQHIKREMRRR